MKTYKIYLIRHAQCEGADLGKYIGHTDAPLSEEGKAELMQMSEDYIYPYPQVVFSSPLKRCTETASILFPDKDPIIIDGLIECNFGEFENKSAEELAGNEDFSGWLEGKNGPPFGETSKDFGKRIYTTFEKIADGMMKSGVFEAAIVTHGGVIGAILSAFGLPEAPIHQWLTPNCKGYVIRLDPGMWMRSRKFEIFAKLPDMKEE